MNAIRHIRRHVFQITQEELAKIAHTKQATVSRWESGKLEPSLEQLKLIRAAAVTRGLAWNDSLFFRELEAA